MEDQTKPTLVNRPLIEAEIQIVIILAITQVMRVINTAPHMSYAKPISEAILFAMDGMQKMDEMGKEKLTKEEMDKFINEIHDFLRLKVYDLIQIPEGDVCELCGGVHPQSDGHGSIQ